MNYGIRSLIIDDDPDDQDIFLMCVNKTGKNVECIIVNSGVDALEMLDADKDYVPNYIFLDVNMPRMNGVECLKRLKQMQRLSQTRIFMYSTTFDNFKVDEIKQLGAYGVIIKPTKTKELIEKLTDLFE